MAYGSIKVDNIIYDDSGDVTLPVSSIHSSISGILTVTGDIKTTGGDVVAEAGVFVGTLGAAATPTYTFSGDNNTGLYASAADQVSISTGGTARLTIESDGEVGIGTTTPSSYLGGSDNLVIAAAADAGLTIATGASNTGTINFADGTSGDARYRGRFEYSHSLDALDVLTAATTALRIDSSGRLLVGTTVSRIVEDNAGNGPQGKIQIEATNSDALMSIISAGTADANRCGTLSLGRHRNSTIGGTPTVVQNNDALGAICFAGGDGSDMRTKGAQIVCQVDGAPSGDDMPGRLMFSTTSDGLHYPSERMRIDSSGRLLVTGGNASLNVSGFQPHIQVAGTTADASTLMTGRFSNDASAPFFIFHKSRNASINGNTSVQSGDILGRLAWYGADGNDYEEAAHIQVEVDASSGDETTDMPGRLVFATTPDGDHNATEAMRIASDGRVAIGTTSPLTGAKVTIAGNSLAITGQNGAHSANSIRIGEEGSGAAQIRCYGPDASNNGTLTFRMSRSDGSNSADVSINTQGLITAPAGHFTSNVTPASGEGLELFQSATGICNIQAYDRTNTDWDTLKIKAQQVEFSCNGSDTVYFGSDGKVGIGTTAPGGQIDVVTSILTKAYFKDGSSNQTSLYIEADNTSARIGTTYHGGGGAFKPLEFLTSGNKRMSILADGKVGIGVDNPTTALEIKGATKIIAPDGGQRYYLESIDAQGAQFSLYDSSDAQNTRISAETSYPTFFGTDVGIGATAPSSDGGTTLEVKATTTPTFLLNHNAQYKALLQLRGNDLEIRGSNGQMEFYIGDADGASSTERMRLTTAGLLGVGTTAPENILHVRHPDAGASHIVIQRNGAASTDGNEYGAILFEGNSYSGAKIASHRDHGTWDDRGDLRFSTGYGNSIFTERVRISNDGSLRHTPYGDTSTQTYLKALGSVAAYTFRAQRDGAVDTAFTWETQNGGTLNECLRILHNGNVGIGTTLSDSYGAGHRVVQIHSGSVNCYLAMTNSTTGDQGADNGLNIIQVGLDTHINNRSQGFIALSTEDFERLRLDTNGLVSTIAGGNSTNYKMRNSAGSGSTVYFIEAYYSGSTTTSGGTVSYSVSTNGNVLNSNDSYGQITSDIKLKENVVDANSQWNDFKAIRFRKYNFKPETGLQTHTQLGVIAQELELVCPNIVFESADKDPDTGEDLGTTTKGVMSSLITKKGLVALQEAMARIETLEAKVAALEAA